MDVVMLIFCILTLLYYVIVFAHRNADLYVSDKTQESYDEFIKNLIPFRMFFNTIYKCFKR